MRDRERAEEERKTMSHLWGETPFPAPDMAARTAAPGSWTEVRSRGEGQRGRRPPGACPGSEAHGGPRGRALAGGAAGGRGAPEGAAGAAPPAAAEAGPWRPAVRRPTAQRATPAFPLWLHSCLKPPWCLQTNDASPAGLRAACVTRGPGLPRGRRLSHASVYIGTWLSNFQQKEGWQDPRHWAAGPVGPGEEAPGRELSQEEMPPEEGHPEEMPGTGYSPRGRSSPPSVGREDDSHRNGSVGLSRWVSAGPHPPTPGSHVNSAKGAC